MHFTNKALSHGNIYIQRCIDSVAVFQERSPNQELIMSFDSNLRTICSNQKPKRNALQ